MDRKLWTALLAGNMVLVLAGCAAPVAEFDAGTTQAAAQSTPTAPLVAVDNSGSPRPPLSGEEVEILSLTAFTGLEGRFYVVGEVRNNSSQPLTLIELSIEIYDATGASLLVDMGTRVPSLLFYPMLTTLAPGEIAPFAYTFDTRTGTPARYDVRVAGYEAGVAARANLLVEHLNLIPDGRGSLYLSGELLNTGSEWVRINGLAGGLLDASSVLRSAEWSPVHMLLLAPAGDAAGCDRTPFVIQIPNPGGDSLTPFVYFDADLVAAPLEYPLSVNVTNQYFDQFGAFHAVGNLTNTGTQPVNATLVAGVYTDEGTVLDASTQTLPVTLGAGEALPFDFPYFNNVNYTPGVADRMLSFSVRVDPGLTWSPETAYVRLASSGDQAYVNGSALTVRGTLTNTFDQPLSRIVVVVLLRDAGLVAVATNYTHIFPPAGAAYIAPGEAISYEVQVEIAPGLDTANFSFVTIVQGEVKE
ncbi:MAG: hypothetical protein JXB85_10205 [Anaerolineales bacterium]|nr:hypothetical protein [Anaerolineales bacterium]